MLISILFLMLQATPYPSDMKRAEICRAHVELLIIDASRETGRVAGPSWFVRDWWTAKLTPKDLTRERITQVEQAVEQRREADAAAFAAERRSCVETAIEAGAVPGMTPG